ncbi:conserved domain protein [Paraprevotella xylaniphila YIT 11841]|uniref:Conserved domain protein n=1 Tax=Paraprevotella xylaniphila YIT 11841 TaxID=762982 RepID=F3QRE1_9BACT|nr:conserved domain protein [Paraprevotella xylaniphila YIT 11841]
MAGGEWELPVLCYITCNQGCSGILFILSMIRCGVSPYFGEIYGVCLSYGLIREFFSCIQEISFLSFVILLLERGAEFPLVETQHVFPSGRELQ